MFLTGILCSRCALLELSAVLVAVLGFTSSGLLEDVTVVRVFRLGQWLGFPGMSPYKSMRMRSLEPPYKVVFCHSRLQQPLEAAENRPRAEFQDVQRAAPDHYGHHERLRRPLLGGSPPAACLGKVSHLHRVGLFAVLSSLRGYRCILHTSIHDE